MSIDRRAFLKLSAAASASLLPAAALGRPNAEEEDFGESFSVLVDTTVCIGCRQCELACNREHDLSDAPEASFQDKSVFSQFRRPKADAFTVVNSIGRPGEGKFPSYLKAQCMHCNHPACVSACIVGAITKCEHGPVTYDASKCIGCRYCMVACPFQIPAYEYDVVVVPRVMKCNFCSDRIHNGKRPACVDACPAEALTFGRRKDLLALAHTRISYNADRYFDHVYGEHEAAGTSWLYLSTVDLTKAGLPTLDGRPIPEHTESIQHAIFKSFLPPIALYGLLGLIMHATGEKDNEESTQ